MSEKKNIFNLAYRYSRALSRWIKAGRPVRCETEIERIYKMCCKPCEAFEEGRCRHCGCYVNLLKSATQNKIAMATEECPLNKWDHNEGKFNIKESPMNKTAEIQQTRMMATCENTVFLTIAAYSDHESRTAAIRKSADDYGVPLVIRDRGEPWQNFYHNKIKRLNEHLKQLHDEGKHFAFFLDCRDVVFIEPVDVILAKFNALYNGRVIFNKDAPGEVWPSHKDYLTRAVEEAMGNKYARINSGMYAGETEKILMMQHHAMILRQELHDGCPRPGILAKLFQEIGTRHTNDDQHLYQICLTYYPELFHIDCAKELFAVLKSYPQDIREHSGDPSRHDVLNNAAIIHSPWMSHGEKWNDWVRQNRWER